jgi:PAS domain S-box-containing protein
VLGFDPERDVIGHSVVDLVAPEDHERAKSAFAAILEGQALGPAQYAAIRNDGKRILLEANRDVLRDSLDQPSGMIYVLRDITHRAVIEGQLRQAQKMESLGRLAGGVAHDFNNHLQVILGYVEIAMQSIAPSQEVYKQLHEVLEAARRSADLNRQLLAFARRQDVVLRVLDLNEEISKTLKMLQRLIGEDIRLVWKPEPNLWPIKADPAQVVQILANLSANARDAISGVGTLIITTSNQVLNDLWCKTHEECIPGEYALLSVSDSGKGIGPEILQHIYEPFFTTKPVGEGTGLGLATVYGIVKQNHGSIDVHSELGHGTMFNIYLPRTTHQTGDMPAEPTMKIRGGNESVLVVEDDQAIANLARGILAQFGYVVLVARTPHEALRIAELNKNPIQLLLTDVVMPEMNGKELVEMLSLIRPGIRTLFMSGYTADAISQRGVIQEGIHFIQKPFSVRSLAAKVREVLDQ